VNSAFRCREDPKVSRPMRKRGEMGTLRRIQPKLPEEAIALIRSYLEPEMWPGVLKELHHDPTDPLARAISTHTGTGSIRSTGRSSWGTGSICGRGSVGIMPLLRASCIATTRICSSRASLIFSHDEVEDWQVREGDGIRALPQLQHTRYLIRGPGATSLVATGLIAEARRARGSCRSSGPR
jgi:hypothetical protein